ncbi:MAG: tRNA lysidine(34) synthetase TilS [Alphaproteobacteria bacterium]|nr:tRNA lysidine(34) synthetase TilS [Alphaproteobacteria bacterium]
MTSFALWEACPRLAVAVSGGADSMALLLLADGWARERQGGVLALTVDHRLRPESVAEAAQVAAWCGARGILHRTLVWEHGTISGNVMAAARKARYSLLAQACEEEGILHLLVAHHAGDQAETHAMRRARDLEVTALAAMPAVREESWGRILRPLLGMEKEVLISFLQAQNQPWLEDPTNQDVAYERTRTRHALTDSGIRECATAVRMAGRERTALEAAAAEALAQCVTLYPWGCAALSMPDWRSLPEAVSLKVLDAVLRCCGGVREGPRRTELRRLAMAMRGEVWRGGSLHGCLVFPSLRQAAERRVIVCRDPAGVAGPLTVLPGESEVWDGRFLVQNNADCPAHISSWGQKKSEPDMAAPPWLAALPARVRDGIPVAWLEDGGEPPHFFPEGSLNPPGLSLTFHSPKPLAGPLFCGTLEA